MGSVISEKAPDESALARGPTGTLNRSSRFRIKDQQSDSAGCTLQSSQTSCDHEDESRRVKLLELIVFHWIQDKRR